MARAFGFGHAGVNIQRAVSFALSDLYLDSLSVSSVNGVWLDEESAKNFKGYRAPSPRSITEIPTIEIANAIKEVIEEEFSLPKEKIPTIAARKLGFYNAGAKITETINTILDMMLQRGDIREMNGMLSFNI